MVWVMIWLALIQHNGNKIQNAKSKKSEIWNPKSEIWIWIWNLKTRQATALQIKSSNMHHGGRNRQACLQCSGQRSGLRQSFGDEAQLRSQSLGSALAPLWGYELGGATPQRFLTLSKRKSRRSQYIILLKNTTTTNLQFYSSSIAALLFQVVFHYIERPLTRWSGKESRKGWLLLGVINSLVI